MKTFSPDAPPSRLLLAAAAALLLPLAAAAAGRQETFQQTVPAAGIREIHVENVNGDVAVTVGSADAVEIVAEKIVRRGNPAEVLPALKIEVINVGGELTIRTVLPQRRRMFGLFVSNSGDCCTVRYAIRVPADRSIRLETVNGSIDVAGVSGTVRAESVNGNVAVSGASGAVDASTVNGRVAVARTDGGGPTRLETVNGDVEVTLASAPAFAYDFETVNGRIDADFPIRVEGKYGPKSARGQVGTEGSAAVVTAESVNGSIRVRRR